MSPDLPLSSDCPRPPPQPSVTQELTRPLRGGRHLEQEGKRLLKESQPRGAARCQVPGRRLSAPPRLLEEEQTGLQCGLLGSGRAARGPLDLTRIDAAVNLPEGPRFSICRALSHLESSLASNNPGTGLGRKDTAAQRGKLICPGGKGGKGSRCRAPTKRLESCAQLEHVRSRT